MEIQTESVDGRFTLVLSGELDLATAYQLHAVLTRVVVLGPSSVTLDLSGLNFCDATGVRAIMRAQGQLAQVGCPLTAVGAHGIVARVLYTTGAANDLELPAQVVPQQVRTGEALAE